MEINMKLDVYKLDVYDIFDEYPNPFYIVKPIIKDGKMDDFRYIYANKAFCIFLGKSREELEGHTFLECFKREGERNWLDAFANAALHKKYLYK
jgi:PAS domain-containing protein